MKDKLEDSVQIELTKMFRENSPKMIGFMLLQMGKLAIEANAYHIDFSQEVTLSNQRYEISAKVIITKC